MSCVVACIVIHRLSILMSYVVAHGLSCVVAHRHRHTSTVNPNAHTHTPNANNDPIKSNKSNNVLAPPDFLKTAEWKQFVPYYVFDSEC